MARKACVPEAAQYSIDEIASKFIDPGAAVFQTLVYRNDAEADHGTVKMEQAEDASVDEGVMRYDIPLMLYSHGEEVPLTVIVNVKHQNRAQLDYTLVSRGMSYAGRLTGQQSPNYKKPTKVYSIWIVSNPEKKDENTVVSNHFRKSMNGAPCDKTEKEADMMEATFFNLGTVGRDGS